MDKLVLTFIVSSCNILKVVNQYYVYMKKRVYEDGDAYIMNYNKHNRFSKVCYTFLGWDVETMKKKLNEMYLSGMSCDHISDWFWDKYKFAISSKGISGHIERSNIRSASAAKRVAMSSGRMVYKKKEPNEKYRSKYISAGVRIKLLNENDYKCSLCGNGRHNGSSLEIHHKDFNEKNGDISNLQVLCFLCHRGIHELKKEEDAVSV